MEKTNKSKGVTNSKFRRIAEPIQLPAKESDPVILLTKKKQAEKSVKIPPIPVEAVKGTEPAPASGPFIANVKDLSKIADGKLGLIFKGVVQNRYSVILKKLYPYLKKEDDFYAKFQEVIRVAPLLKQNPHIPKIIEYGEFDNDFYIIREYIPGISLDRMVLKVQAQEMSHIPISIAIYIIEQILEILKYVYSHPDDAISIPHGDISPTNIIISNDGELYINDFFISRAYNHFQTDQIRKNILENKISFMAPEQIKDGIFDLRTDLYSVGALLYFLGTHIFPFRGASYVETYQNIMRSSIWEPSLYNSNITYDLESIIVKAMQHAPKSRYQSIEELQDAIINYKLINKLITAQKIVGEFVQFFNSVELEIELTDRGIG